MKNKMLKKGLAIGMSAFLLASSLAPVSVQAASWKQNKTGWWWQEDNGSYPVSQWKVINGKWYAFDERGYMRSGWFLSNGKWYYLGGKSDGSMKIGWNYVNGKWYYMNGDGAMLSSQWVGQYWVDSSGAWTKTMENPRWVRSGSRWWYRHGDGGYTANGWEAINGRWYYFDGSGWMVTGWKLVNGSWYYMNSDGAMLSNQWVGDYYVGPTGAMLTDQWIGNYYVDASGKWVPNKQQHEHVWQSVTSTVEHPAETHLKAFVKGVRGYFSYYLRRFSLCFCLNNAFQPVLSSQTATMVKKHFDFIICFALLNHKNSIRFVFLRMVIWGG